MGSFKVKLVAYFVLLSLLPLAAAFWGFSTVAARAETRRVDARLQAGLRATVAAYQEQLDSAAATAEALAQTPAFGRALVGRDRDALRKLLAGKPNLSVVIGGFRIGTRIPGAATRRVSVLGPGGARGAVIASVPLDAKLLRRLQVRSGLDPDDRVILLVGGQVVGGLPLEGGAVHATPGGPHTTVIGRTRYRVLLAGTLDEQKSTTLGVVSPQSKIDAANWDAERRLLIGLLGSLVLVATVAYFEGRAIVRTIRRLVDAARAIARGDLRERVPVQGRDELALLGRTFNQMADSCRRASTSSPPSASGCEMQSPASVTSSARPTTSISSGARSSRRQSRRRVPQAARWSGRRVTSSRPATPTRGRIGSRSRSRRGASRSAH